MLRRAAEVDYLTLVNAERPWRPDERLRLVPVNRQDKGVMLQSEAACQLNRLLQQLTGSAEAGWQQMAQPAGAAKDLVAIAGRKRPGVHGAVCSPAWL